MILTRLLHNKGAGDEDHDREKLTGIMRSEGYQCEYASLDNDDWKHIPPETELLVIAGGDGTIRQVTEALLNAPANDKKIPVTFIPLGTANNISKSLGIDGDAAEIITSWKSGRLKEFNIRKLNISAASGFFLESVGCGVLVKLMNDMKSRDDKFSDQPEKRMNAALRLLYKIIYSYIPVPCKLNIDSKDYTDEFLMIEVMNICSIGPNLDMVPLADPSAEELNVILITERERDSFAAYVLDKLNGKEAVFPVAPIRARNITIYPQEKELHIDDEVIDREECIEITASGRKAIPLLVPGDK